jgi:hypothetical protein
MTEAGHILGPFRKLEAVIREAVAESKLAYEFSANSYSFSAMSACIAAERALENNGARSLIRLRSADGSHHGRHHPTNISVTQERCHDD